MLFLLDIAHYQQGLNIPLAASQGFVAIACKATEGTTFADPSFNTFIPQIKAAGLIPGAYHFLRSGDGAAQARWFLSRVQVQGGPEGFLIQLDCESDGLGPQMAAWAAEWNRLTGHHPFLIYSGSWWWPRTGGYRGADLTPYLWHSHYTTGSGSATALYGQVAGSWWTPGYGGWPRATLLQFTSTGTAGGQLVDFSAYLGSLDELRALTTTGDSMALIDDPHFRALIYRVAAIIGMQDTYDNHANNPAEVNMLTRELSALRAALAESGAKEAAVLAAVVALAEQIRTGGGNVETGPIVAAIQASAKAVGDRVLGELREAAQASAAALLEPPAPA